MTKHKHTDHYSRAVSYLTKAEYKQLETAATTAGYTVSSYLLMILIDQGVITSNRQPQKTHRTGYRYKKYLPQ